MRAIEALAERERFEGGNVTNIYGNTPLQRAVADGKVDILRILARFPRVDFSCRDTSGRTRAEIAVSTRNLNCVNFLAAEESFDCWNLPGRFGSTLIMSSLVFDQKEIFETLTRCPRVDLNMADENGKTLANLTVESGSVECVESLIMQRRFYCWNVPDKNDNTPLTIAVSSGNFEIFKILEDIAR